MDAEWLNGLIDGKVQECLKTNNAELLQNIEGMMTKISSTTSVVHSPAVETPTFKRRSNEEQFKQNSQLLVKLEGVEANINSGNLLTAKESVLEAKEILRRRPKLIQLADSSELGWRTVDEYEMNPIASDSDDEQRIYKAEARANRKAMSDREKARKAKARQWPYVSGRDNRRQSRRHRRVWCGRLSHA